jgi:hypothetical protein
VPCLLRHAELLWLNLDLNDEIQLLTRHNATTSLIPITGWPAAPSPEDNPILTFYRKENVMIGK